MNIRDSHRYKHRAPTQYMKWKMLLLLPLLMAAAYFVSPFLPQYTQKISINDVVYRAQLKDGDSNKLPSPQLVIPSIGMSAYIESVGATEQGNMEVPINARNVGEYRYGSSAGEAGNATITGHVDNWLQPGVFRQLKQVKVGDMVYVIRDSKKMTFKVIESVSYPIDNAPLEKIFGKTDKKRLNLITCDGLWNVGEWQYGNRLVVFSELVSTETL